MDCKASLNTWRLWDDRVDDPLVTVAVCHNMLLELEAKHTDPSTVRVYCVLLMHTDPASWISPCTSISPSLSPSFCDSYAHARTRGCWGLMLMRLCLSGRHLMPHHSTASVLHSRPNSISSLPVPTQPTSSSTLPRASFRRLTLGRLM